MASTGSRTPRPCHGLPGCSAGGRRPTELPAVLAHLGGGASVCAVQDARSVWTSMGLTPLDGPAMSTRSGSVDPGLLST
ncbi:MAG: hypothetical protein ACRDYZ_01705 [Acidimicrobiales bacterium]